MKDTKKRTSRFLPRVSVFLCMCAVFSCLTVVSPRIAAADSVSEGEAAIAQMQEELALLKRNREAADAAYEEAQAAYDAAELDVEKAQALKESLDRQIAALEEEIDYERTLIEDYEERLADLSVQIAEKEAEIADCREVFINRIRSNYEDSFVSYVEMVLSSDSFSDLLYRLDIVNSLLDYDKRVMKTLDESRQELVAMQQQQTTMLEGEKEAYDSLVEQVPVLEEKKTENEEAIERFNEALLAAYNDKEASAEEKEEADRSVALLQEQIDNQEAEIAEMIREAQEAALKAAAEKAAREAAERAAAEEESRAEESRQAAERAEEESREAKEHASETEQVTETVTTEAETEEKSETEAVTTENSSKQGTAVYGETGYKDYDGSGFIWPVSTVYSKITSTFGYRAGIYGQWELHNGIDIPCDYGAPVYASSGGTVIIATYHYSYGYYVVIDHGSGITTLYAHNSKLLVSVGDVVSQGDQIACAGSTGDSTGNHCHFTVRVNGTAVDPLGYVTQP